MMREIYRAKVGFHFVFPVQYSDITGISATEEELLDWWISGLPEEGCHTFEFGYDKDIGRCDISEMICECVEVIVYLP